MTSNCSSREILFWVISLTIYIAESSIALIYKQRTASLLLFAEPIMPIFRLISVIQYWKCLSASSIFTDSGSKGKIFFISLLSISYLRKTSFRSFLVLYEEDDLSLFSLHSLAKSASLVAGPPGIP